MGESVYHQLRRRGEGYDAGVRENVVDPSLRARILPKFSTTTTTDTIVASVIMMSNMKKYCDFKFSLMCGLPDVTLEGAQEDWEERR